MKFKSNDKISKKLLDLFEIVSKEIENKFEFKTSESFEIEFCDMNYFKNNNLSCEYGEYNDKIYILEESRIQILFKENFEIKFRKIIEFVLIKITLSKKYEKNLNEDKKDLIDSISKIISFEVNREMIKYKIEKFENSNLSKKELIDFTIYLIYEISNEEFLVGCLDDIFNNKTQNIIEEIYGRSFEDMIKHLQNKIADMKKFVRRIR